MLTFTQLLAQIKATYRTETNAFHVLATRYYLGAETNETLRNQASDMLHSHKLLTHAEVDEIIANR